MSNLINPFTNMPLTELTGETPVTKKQVAAFMSNVIAPYEIRIVKLEAQVEQLVEVMKQMVDTVNKLVDTVNGPEVPSGQGE